MKRVTGWWKESLGGWIWFSERKLSSDDRDDSERWWASHSQRYVSRNLELPEGGRTQQEAEKGWMDSMLETLRPRKVSWGSGSSHTSSCVTWASLFPSLSLYIPVILHWIGQRIMHLNALQQWIVSCKLMEALCSKQGVKCLGHTALSQTNLFSEQKPQQGSERCYRHVLARHTLDTPCSVKKPHPNPQTLSQLEFLFQRSDVNPQNEDGFKKLKLNQKVNKMQL